MVEQLSWLRNGNTLLLFGKLNQDLINPLWNVRYKVMRKIQQINLSGVTCVDTAGIALLIHLIAIGKAQGGEVTLVGINDSIHTLARLYNLPNDVLPR